MLFAVYWMRELCHCSTSMNDTVGQCSAVQLGLPDIVFESLLGLFVSTFGHTCVVLVANRLAAYNRHYTLLMLFMPLGATQCPLWYMLVSLA